MLATAVISAIILEFKSLDTRAPRKKNENVLVVADDIGRASGDFELQAKDQNDYPPLLG